jgi:hypothetical protein
MLTERPWSFGRPSRPRLPLNRCSPSVPVGPTLRGCYCENWATRFVVIRAELCPKPITCDYTKADPDPSIVDSIQPVSPVFTAAPPPLSHDSPPPRPFAFHATHRLAAFPPTLLQLDATSTDGSPWESQPLATASIARYVCNAAVFPAGDSRICPQPISHASSKTVVALPQMPNRSFPGRGYLQDDVEPHLTPMV